MSNKIFEELLDNEAFSNLIMTSEKSEFSENSAWHNKSYSEKKIHRKVKKKSSDDKNNRFSCKNISPLHIVLDNSPSKSVKTKKSKKKSSSNNYISNIPNLNINIIVDNLHDKLKTYDSQLLSLVSDKKESYNKLVILEQENKKLQSDISVLNSSNKKTILKNSNNIMEAINNLNLNVSSQKEKMNKIKLTEDKEKDSKLKEFFDSKLKAALNNSNYESGDTNNKKIKSINKIKTKSNIADNSSKASNELADSKIEIAKLKEVIYTITN